MNRISFFLLGALFFNFTLQAAEAAVPNNMVLVIDELIEALKKDSGCPIKNYFHRQLFGFDGVHVLLVVSVSKELYGDQISQVMKWVNQNLSDRLIKPQAQHKLIIDGFQVEWQNNGCVYVERKIDISQQCLDFIYKKLPEVIDRWRKEEIDKARARTAEEKDKLRGEATARLKELGYRPNLAKSMGFSHSPTGSFKPFVQHPAIKN